MKWKLKADWDIVGVCVCECVETWELSVSWKMRKKITLKGHPWSKMLEKGVRPGKQGRTDTSSQVMELPPASPGPLPTRSPHGLVSSPLPSRSGRATLAHASMVLHVPTWSAGSPRSLLNSDFPSQTQLADHLFWETLLIPALTESKCSSLAIKDIGYIGVFIPSNFPPEWKYLEDYAQFTQIEHSRNFEWMNE